MITSFMEKRATVQRPVRDGSNTYTTIVTGVPAQFTSFSLREAADDGSGRSAGSSGTIYLVASGIDILLGDLITRADTSDKYVVRGVQRFQKDMLQEGRTVFQLEAELRHN